MAFKAVTDLNADTTVSLGGVNKKTGKANPKSVEGYYLGKRTVEDRKKKSGESYIYILQTAKGNLGVWGKTDMDRKMTQVTTGAMIRIAHTGMAQTPNGEMYKYSVEQDLDNTIEVTNDLSAAANTGADDDGDDTSTNDDGGLDSDEIDGGYEATPLVASASAADRAAKVQALLAKNKRK